MAANLMTIIFTVSSFTWICWSLGAQARLEEIVHLAKYFHKKIKILHPMKSSKKCNMERIVFEAIEIDCD